ncbi:unnamed protein product [Rhizophagus irregularis]|nr:unnamed protein product [Rhizophagus irregularis]
MLVDYTFGIWQQFWVSAIIWDFDKGFGFQQQFGISATVWDFGNSLGFWQWFWISAIVWDLEFGFGILANSKTIFQHLSNPKHVLAPIGFGTQV